MDSTDWTAGSVIEDGSDEAAGAEDAVVRAVLELPGGGQPRDNECDIEHLWRCGSLRDAALGVDAMPLLKRAVDAGAAQCGALWAPCGIPPMDFRFYSIPPRSIAQQGGLSCAACAAAPPTEPLQGPPKA